MISVPNSALKVVYTNYIKNPRVRPAGQAPVGADPNTTKIVAGALGRGAQTAAGITTFNQFWCYIIPLFGAWIADTYLGRYVSCGPRKCQKLS